MRNCLILIFVLSFFGCESNRNEDNSAVNPILKSPFDLVNTFIGTGGHGHTFPGATAPHGMVQLSPDTRLEGWDGCGGYHYTDSIIFGFSHTHLSGTGIPDYGDVLLTPFTGDKINLEDAIERITAPSYFDKSTEKAHPGYYSVFLENHDLAVELSTTERTGMHRYVNLSEDELHVLIDLRHRDKLRGYEIDFVSDRVIRGKRISQAWANEQHVYFYMEFSAPFHVTPFSNNESVDSIRKQFAQLSFGALDSLLVKVGISAVDIAGAQQNLEIENSNWNFEKIREEMKNKWESALSKIEIEGGTEEQRTIFYSALYHAIIVPNLFSDQDGRYRGVDMKIHQDSSDLTYTIFSLWDTFRSAHPLYTLIDQTRTNSYINTFLKHYDQGGKLPMWELSANYTGCMIGYHAVPVIADAHIKGITGWDINKAFEAMVSAANTDHLGITNHIQQGYISMGNEPESVSKLLEYCYDDWCIGSMAERISDQRAHEFYNRSLHYKNIFDPETGFMRGRNNGMFQFPFDPSEVNFCFTEANSWQYSMFVPQDISGMIQLYGGPDTFEAKLDELFSTASNVSGRHQVDITGLIGQYAHGNEPSHHMAYLYNYIGKPWKTAEKVEQIMRELYTSNPDGYCGNEDCGQMSAWYVLSALGIYAVTPGTDYYTIGHPIFDSATIHLENGNDFTISAARESNRSFGVKSCFLNGMKYNKSFINHFDIMKGGELHFELTDNKQKEFGTQVGNIPITSVQNNAILPVPYFVAENYSFEDSLLIEVKSPLNKKMNFIVNINGKTQQYDGPFWLKETSLIEARIINERDQESLPAIGTFKKRDKNMTIIDLSAYANQYAGGGKQALVDGIDGGFDYRTGFWQGVQGTDYFITIDRGRQRPINQVTIGCFQDIKSWIWFPKEIEIYTSNDNINFTLSTTITNDFSRESFGNFKHDFETSLKGNARYIKINAVYPGDCPQWHLGAGGKAWIFMDEVTID